MAFHTILPYYTILYYLHFTSSVQGLAFMVNLFSFLSTGGPSSYFLPRAVSGLGEKHGRLGKVPFLGSVLLSRWDFMLYIVSICYFVPGNVYVYIPQFHIFSLFSFVFFFFFLSLSLGPLFCHI
ncbi:hypothetical protein H105_03419 [Trichophyton soudanense CBS 452.61]|uniref:Uncharacterized protein n=1 Tax=Trichophyton soudanense CBS 452.61 TaxID=1215331 RepID=A0A022XVZ9_TRISD|nr:hypothetical protein H105_03419 [Trichophyton soudanense CBS 452.61]